MSPTDYQLIETADELRAAAEELSKHSVLGFDTETTELDPYKGRLRLVQLAAPDGVRVIDLDRFTDGNGGLKKADALAPLEACVFNIGANVNFPLLETTERVFRKVWEMACYAGFLTGREAARLMLPRGRGNIFFTGATAGMRGGVGYAAFASAKFGLRAVAQSAARELGPKGIHVAPLVLDAGVDIRKVQELLGHRHVTTQIYDKRRRTTRESASHDVPI